MAVLETPKVGRRLRGGAVWGTGGLQVFAGQGLRNVGVASSGKSDRSQRSVIAKNLFAKEPVRARTSDCKWL